MRAVQLIRCLDSLKSVQCVLTALRSSVTNPTHISPTFLVGSTIERSPAMLRRCSFSRCRHLSSASTSDSKHSSTNSDDWSDVPVVKAFVHVPENYSSNPIVGVYWHDNSKQNRFKEHAKRTKITAEIEAVCLAVKQAVIKMELQRVHIVTNSKFVCKNFGKNSLWWSLDEFMRQKAMTFSLCTAEAEDLYRLLHMIEVKLEYDPSVDETAKKLYKNLSVGKMGDNFNGQSVAIQENMAAKSAVPKSREKDTGTKLATGSVTPTDSSSLASKHHSFGTPIVYTCGVYHTSEEGEKKFPKAGYGVYWPHSRELGTGRRYNFYPVTLIRCQLQAIIEALQQAVDRNYRSIILRTDCVSFLVHHSRQWLKANGSYVKYHDQYLRIVDLCKEVKVRFQPAENEPIFLKEAEALAQNGVCLPLPPKKFRKRITAEGDNTTGDDNTPVFSGIKCCA